MSCPIWGAFTLRRRWPASFSSRAATVGWSPMDHNSPWGNGIVQAGQDCDVTVSVTGAAELAAPGSADPFNTQPYTGQCHHTYYGRLQAVLRAGNTPGAVHVTVTAGTMQQELSLCVQ